MEKKISATEARIHFGALIRKVKEEQQPYIVERDGEPYVVLLAAEAYARLKQNREPDWREALSQARQLREKMAARRGDMPLPDPAEMIREMREDRTRQLLETLEQRDKEEAPER